VSTSETRLNCAYVFKGRDILNNLFGDWAQVLTERVESYLNGVYTVSAVHTILNHSFAAEAARLDALNAQESEQMDRVDGVIVRRCGVTGCNITLTGTSDTIHKICREHIQNQHAFRCAWRGCQCATTRGTCGEAPGHAAHITDIGRHYLSHFKVPASGRRKS
jgi:hypothetical protein